MCEVTRENFDDLLPEILSQIDDANFMAIDCEFTALQPDEYSNNSLFDSLEKRYQKIAHPCVHSIISQFGLAIFKQNINSNTYYSQTYNFFICPRSFASVDVRFVCQASSLEFLTRFNFDFNKFIHHGIPCLNLREKAILKKDLSDGALLRPLDRNIPIQDEDGIRRICNQLAGWVSTAQIGESLEVDAREIVPYVLHLEVRRKFNCLWSYQNDKSFFVRKVTNKERKLLDSEESEKEIANKLLETMHGFSKVILHISKSGKPIVGHNCLLDLIKIYNQFYTSLPSTYKEFKRKVHILFPVVYDTKHIVFNIKKRIGKTQPQLEKILSNSNLNLLHKELDEYGNNYNNMWTPKISHAEDFKLYENTSNPHEAAYDAFMAGYCFVRLAHLAATISHMDIKKMRVMSFLEKIDVLSDHRNHINIARGVVNHINLEGQDPPSTRPTWLFVKSKCGKLDIMTLAEKFARFDRADFRPKGKSITLVAVCSNRGASDIIREFNGKDGLIVESYSYLKHKKELWIAGLGLTIGAVGLIWTLHKL